MPPKRKAPKAAASKPAQEPTSEDDVKVVEPSVEKSKKTKEPKQTKKSAQVEDVPAASKKSSRQAKQQPKYNDNVSDEDTPEVPAKKTKKGKESKEEPLSEEDVVVVEPVEKTKKTKGPKQAKKSAKDGDVPAVPKKSSRQAKQQPKYTDNLSDEDTPEVPVKKTKKGKEPKVVENPAEKGETNAKPPARKRGAAKQVVESEESEVEVPVKKQRGARAPGKAAAKKTETKAAPMNGTETKWDNINFDCDKQNKEGKSHNLQITSWNVDGIRSWLNKEGLDILSYSKPDIFCLQETRCSDGKLPEELAKIDHYHAYWCSGKKEGYAGVGIYSKIEPLDIIHGIGNKEYDDEGRCITCEYDKFFLVNVYVPNAGRGLKTLEKRLEWNELFKAFVKKLDEKKPVIVCGDMNVAHNEIDLSNPKSNKKNAGFTQEERDGMTDFLQDGYIDTFREMYPEQKDAYTFWSYMSKARAKNIGWRLDYFIVSQRISDKVCDNIINKEVFGSDHCPITLFINI